MEEDTEVFRVFLAPRGRKRRTGTEQWKHLTFLDLAGLFRGVPELQDKPGYHFLRYYLTGVLKDICGVPVPIANEIENPYTAIDYLQTVLRTGKDEEKENGDSR